MQDLNALGSRLQLDLLRDWPGPRAVEGGCQPVLALSVLVDTSLLSFSFSFSLHVFSNSSLVVF